MRSRLTCVISAAMAVLLIVCTVNYAFNIGKEKRRMGFRIRIFFTVVNILRKEIFESITEDTFFLLIFIHIRPRNIIHIFDKVFGCKGNT